MPSNLQPTYPLYLGNEALFTSQNLSVTDKYSNRPITQVSLANESIVDQAIQLACDAAPRDAGYEAL